jgi:hypothetical protein
MEREKVLYELEYQVNELRKAKLQEIEYNDMTIKEFLDLGFDNSFILLNGEWFNLGYKWFVGDNYGYESDDFGELTKEQLNCLVKYVDSELTDYNYQHVDVELVNSEDNKYFRSDNNE